MSMSKQVVGLVPPDAKWRAMRDVWDACRHVGVPVPDAVDKFFDYVDPDENGMEYEIPKTEWCDDSRSGFDVTVADIPANVKVLRFYNSW